MKLSYKPVEEGFQVRLMSPLGSYPSSNFVAESAALVVTPELCFSIARVKGADWSFSEVDKLCPREIPLLGTVLLSGDAGDPYIYPYPADTEVLLETTADIPLSAECFAECTDFLLAALRKIGSRSPAETIHIPPALGGASYELVSTSQRRAAEQLSNFHHLQAADPLLIRGVALLLKAHMAWRHRELAEAACIFLWICLDAAHSLILRKLRASGINNPTSKDAARWFESMSGYDTGWDRFFEDDYDNRIRAVHPDSRFGAEARPQFLADDFLELNDVLVPLFQHLVAESA